MSILFGQVVRGMSAGARAFEYMEMRPSIKLSGGKKLSKDKIKGEVLLDGVRFSYPTRPEHVVMENMSLKIEAGKVIALCGPSGSGLLFSLYILIVMLCKRRFYGRFNTDRIMS